MGHPTDHPVAGARVTDQKPPHPGQPRPDGFPGAFCRLLKEDQTAILQFFQKLEEGGALPLSLYEASISTSVPKPD